MPKAGQGAGDFLLLSLLSCPQVLCSAAAWLIEAFPAPHLAVCGRNPRLGRKVLSKQPDEVEAAKRQSCSLPACAKNPPCLVVWVTLSTFTGRQTSIAGGRGRATAGRHGGSCITHHLERIVLEGN
jgi:hypothetical protein